MDPKEREEAFDKGFKNESEYYKQKVLLKRKLRSKGIIFNKEFSLNELEALYEKKNISENNVWA